VKKENGENTCQCYLADQRLQQLQEKVDFDLAQKTQQAGCLRCGGRLDRADYERKPRGGPEHWDQRLSLCCAKDGCRKRHTPPSVRFLGRKVYVAHVVVLISAMRHGLNPGVVRILAERLGIDRRTLERWRHWWIQSFVESPFWKAARARFMPPICEATLPQSLCEQFGVDHSDRFLELLKFLSPVTTASISLDHLI
jgi:hypothetical protein